MKGAYESFRVGVGIDDEVLTVPVPHGAREVVRGLADARILADGKELWSSERLQGGTGLTEVGLLDVRGVQELVLEVGLGPDGMNTLDRVDWVEPLLIEAR